MTKQRRTGITAETRIGKNSAKQKTGARENVQLSHNGQAVAVRLPELVTCLRALRDAAKRTWVDVGEISDTMPLTLRNKAGDMMLLAPTPTVDPEDSITITLDDAIKRALV